jgi:hypothetical protein
MAARTSAAFCAGSGAAAAAVAKTARSIRIVTVFMRFSLESKAALADVMGEGHKAIR